MQPRLDQIQLRALGSMDGLDPVGRLPTSAEFKGATGNGDWPDCLAQMDHSVGRLLDTIDQLGKRDDTIFVFTSDNGADISTPPWIGTCGPWAGSMFTPMEGNNRVSFIIRWPGEIPADRESNEIVPASEEIALVHAINGPVLGYLGPGKPRQCRESIHLMAHPTLTNRQRPSS